MHRSANLHDVPTVFVVDPDPSTAAVARSFLDGSNVRCDAYSTCRDFLAAYSASRPGCLVLEHRIADMSGYQLQRRLAADGVGLPLVFVLAHPNVNTAVELMRGGAVHVLEKPVRSIELLNAIQEALELDHDRRLRAEDQARFRQLVDGLTHKEREVLDLIAHGRSVKSMAAHLQLSVRAVEQRRSRLMEKLQVGSPLDLMRFSVSTQQLDEPSPATLDDEPVRCGAGTSDLRKTAVRAGRSQAMAEGDPPFNKVLGTEACDAVASQEFDGLAAALSAAINNRGSSKRSQARRD